MNHAVYNGITYFHIIHYHVSQYFICFLNANTRWSDAFIQLFSVMLRFIPWADVIHLEACELYEHLRCLPSVLSVLPLFYHCWFSCITAFSDY